MIVKDDQRVITHYGIRGMKWGIRNDGSADARRAKAKKITKNISTQDSMGAASDFANANWASKTVPEKMFGAMANTIALDMLGSMATQGKPPDFKDPKWAVNLVVKAATTYGIKEINSNNALKRYTDEGKRDPTKKQYDGFTPEHAISLGIRGGLLAGRVAVGIGTKKLVDVVKTRRETEARMDSWGSRLFDTKTSDMHTIYDDGYMSILEKIKP